MPRAGAQPRADRSLARLESGVASTPMLWQPQGCVSPPAPHPPSCGAPSACSSSDLYTFSYFL